MKVEPCNYEYYYYMKLPVIYLIDLHIPLIISLAKHTINFDFDFDSWVNLFLYLCTHQFAFKFCKHNNNEYPSINFEIAQTEIKFAINSKTIFS